MLVVELLFVVMHQMNVFLNLGKVELTALPQVLYSTCTECDQAEVAVVVFVVEELVGQLVQFEVLENELVKGLGAEVLHEGLVKVLHNPGLAAFAKEFISFPLVTLEVGQDLEGDLERVAHLLSPVEVDYVAVADIEFEGSFYKLADSLHLFLHLHSP